MEEILELMTLMLEIIMSTSCSAVEESESTYFNPK